MRGLISSVWWWHFLIILTCIFLKLEFRESEVSPSKTAKLNKANSSNVYPQAKGHLRETY